MFFILISIFFKIGIAPFHNWSPDVYEGTALPTTVYFAVVIKFAMISPFLPMRLTPHIGWCPLKSSQNKTGCGS